MKNILMVVIDGLGDEYISELDGTPLEYASEGLKNLNKMVNEGLCGLHWPVEPGIPPSSGKAHLSLFGYDIQKFKVGRGVFEALGSGMQLEPNEVAFRTNFGTVEEKNGELMVKDRRAGRIKGDEAEKLSHTIQKVTNELNFPAQFKHTVEHRGVFTIKGEFSDRISDTDPHAVGEPILRPQPLQGVKGDEREEAENTCQAIKQATATFYQALSQHPVNKKRKKEGKKPANALLMRGGGTPIDIPSFKKKWGVNAAYTAEAALYKGIAQFVGMESLPVQGKLDFSGKNERKRVEKALEALRGDYDFIFLHVKLADNFSHSKEPRKKAEFLKNLDQSFEPLLHEENVLLILTGDHSSSSMRARHIGTPVPLFFWGDTPQDRCEKLTEKELADKGGIGIIKGKQILPIALDLADRAEELGIRTHPSLPHYKKRGKGFKHPS